MKALQSSEIPDNTRPKRERLIPKTCIFGNITLWETHVSHLLFWPITFILHCATSHKVAGSISDGVIGIFHWLDPSGHTTVPRSTLPRNRNEYQGYLLWRKGGRCVRLTLPTSCADCLEILEASTLWNPKGISRPVWGDTVIFCLSRPYLIWTCFFYPALLSSSTKAVIPYFSTVLYRNSYTALLMSDTLYFSKFSVIFFPWPLRTLQKYRKLTHLAQEKPFFWRNDLPRMSDITQLS
jgi:hypothetical protein